MPGWISDLISVAPWLAAVLIVVGAAVWSVRKLGPFVLKLVHFVDDVAGEPARPGFEARPGLMERLATVETKQDEQGAAIEIVRHEVTTNHGSSLKDAVKKLEQKFDKHLEVRDGQDLPA